MKIREFIAFNESDGAYPFKLKFRKPKGMRDNCFSILVGANGTRKSRTLRDIVDIVVPRPSSDSTYIEGKGGQIRLWEQAIIPHVIAVSGVATDRFPSRMNAKRLGRTRASYSYIGPRTDNNLVSRVQSVQQVAAAILAESNALSIRAVGLRSAFSTLKLAPYIYFYVEVDELAGGSWSLARLKSVIDSSRLSLSANVLSGDILQRSVRFLRAKKSARIHVDLHDKCTLDTGPAEPDVLQVLLQLGVLRVKRCNGLDSVGATVDLTQLSSGQWHLLSSLIFVAATVTDGTLVLVDEPENSLHPAWQQEYLPLLQKAISTSKGVHVVVSTHSPHVASSLSSDIAEVIALSWSRSRVRSKPLVSGPYGWAADNILRVVFGLESTRSRDFTKQIDTALKLFSKGNRKDPLLVKKVRALAQIVGELPNDDAVREVIQTMSALVEMEVED
jgi:hypothetical protein